MAPTTTILLLLPIPVVFDQKDARAIVARERPALASFAAALLLLPPTTRTAVRCGRGDDPCMMDGALSLPSPPLLPLHACAVTLVFRSRWERGRAQLSGPAP